ncbi:hypothetical protein CTI12_AA599390 [Artemisia annua]|uniref:Uncharacterized protein n=1 Tax=Artemisia annua TaxID=35608 RepID=A0A2U1KIB2_ARTAN|nr:hypothetical protein CTI12_AA599390 [Artemisia annua]
MKKDARAVVPEPHERELKQLKLKKQEKKKKHDAEKAKEDLVTKKVSEKKDVIDIIFVPKTNYKRKCAENERPFMFTGGHVI